MRSATYLIFAMISYLSILKSNFALTWRLFRLQKQQGKFIPRFITKNYAVSSKSSAPDTWESSSGNTLVIVESPTKARTIQQFLGEGYTVDFCAGHIRDLPKNPKLVPKKFKKQIILEELRINVGDLGVDVYNNFEPIYIDMEGKKDVIDRLKNLAKKCSRILFATDEDREGEAISWHLLEALNPMVPYKRAVFHEISEDAIKKSFENPREININLVQSQETRRILDRLTGFTISPLLWRYINPKLSAGRVQSCGLHLIVQRERKIRQFVPSYYFSLDALFQLEAPTLLKSSSQVSTLKMNLANVDGKRVATQKDFVDSTGEPVPDVLVLNKDITENIMTWLSGQSNPFGVRFIVIDVTSRTTARPPPQPLITSTLQQLASSQLSMSPSRTMSVAQELYEKGYITYMRTDSPGLSTAATEAARNHVVDLFGKEYLDPSSTGTTAITPVKPSKQEDSDDALGEGDTKLKKKSTEKGSKNKAPLNAQEAHEAIRPVITDGKFKSPKDTDLTLNLLSLYSLVYNHTLASVMMPSQSLCTTYKVDAQSQKISDDLSKSTKKTRSKKQLDALQESESSSTPTHAVFKTSHTVVLFPGYMKAYANQESSEDEVPENSSPSSKYPVLTKGQELWLAKDIIENITSKERGRTKTKASAIVGDINGESGRDIIDDNKDLTSLTDSEDQDQVAGGGEAVGKPIVMGGLRGMHHSTRPPHRYTIAGFIKELETVGVGRPSTYASIFNILKDRNYVMTEGQTLVPTNMGMLVAGLLATHFPDLVEPAFTAKLEESLDLIASGNEDKINFLTKFYLGADNELGLLKRITTKLRSNEIDHRASRSLMKFGDYLVRLGSGGFFIEKDTEVKLEDGSSTTVTSTSASGRSEAGSDGPIVTTTATITSMNPEVEDDAGVSKVEEDSKEEKSVRWMLPENMQEDYRTLSESSVLEVVTTSATTQGRMMGTDPTSDLPVFLRTGRYGPYVQIGYDDEKKQKKTGNKKCASVPKWVMETDSTLEQILAFSNLPKDIGIMPTLQKSIVLEVSQGQLSVGVKGYPHRVKLPENIWVEDVTESYALPLLVEKDILNSQKVLGDYNNTSVFLKKGRFGYYVQQGTEIRSLKKLDPETLTLEDAIQLLDIPRKWTKKRSTYATKAKKAATLTKKTKKVKITNPDINENVVVTESSAKRKRKSSPSSSITSDNILTSSSSKSLEKTKPKPKPTIKSKESTKTKPKAKSTTKKAIVKDVQSSSLSLSSPPKKLNGYQQFIKESSKNGIPITIAAANWKSLSEIEKETYKTQSSHVMSVMSNPTDILV